MKNNYIIIATTVSCTGLVGLIAYYWYHFNRKKKGKEDDIPFPGFLEKSDDTILFTERIHQISSIGHCQGALENIYRDIQTIRIVGLDCEWVSRSRHVGKVALLQIATPAGNTYLFRCCLFDKTKPFPESLATFLKDKSIIKTGVSVLDDGRKLTKDYGLTVRGCVDVRYLATRIIKSLRTSEKLGLRNLADIILGIQLDKSNYIRCSDWECEQMDQQQVVYAALDAFVSLDLFLTVAATKCGHVRYSADTAGWMALQSKCGSLVSGLVDIKFRREAGDGSNHRTSSKISSNSRRDVDTSIAKAKTSYSQRKSLLYDNCQLFAPDGRLLSTIDRKKAQWYLSKGLGEVVHDNPYTIRINFEPAGRPGDADQYYLLEKENKCTVCGCEESCIRKYIVPHEYRRHFPDAMKSKVSHDILLLCIPCHALSNIHDGETRKWLAEQCAAPVGSEDHIRSNYEDRTRFNVRSSASALLKNRDRIPAKRIEELLSIIRDYYSIDDVTDSVLKETAKLETRVFNESFVPHGLRVVKHYTDRGPDGLWQFVKLWRQHFVEKMQPQHLPELWSIEHRRYNVEDTTHRPTEPHNVETPTEPHNVEPMLNPH